MSQCVGRSQRTGERCRRSAAAGAATCYYHGAASVESEQPSPRVERSRAATERRSTLTTKQLSKRTWSDFEKLFAPRTGWGRCACLFALDAPRATRGGTWAEQRETNLRTMRRLVDERRSHGVLVYDGHDPVGWCQFVASDHVRFAAVAASGADWYVTCFVVDPRYRGLGVSAIALRAAVRAITERGGGVVEGSAIPIAPGPAPKPDSKDLYQDGDVLFWGGFARVRYGVDVEGVGPVAALYRSRRSMHGAPLGGTVELFRREGFDAVAVLPRPRSALADRVVMRRTV